MQGEFVWHQHADEDELFLVIRGELVVIPKGVEHRPVAREEVHLLLVEPKEIRHTGDVISERTISEYARI